MRPIWQPIPDLLTVELRPCACYDAAAYMTEYAIGLDLGGTNLRAAAIDRSGHACWTRSPARPISTRAAKPCSPISSRPSPNCAKSTAPTGSRGIGVGVPGFIRMKEGLITNSNNLPYLENVPIRDEISRRLGTCVILENDANAAALGEKWMGAGRDVDDLVLLTLGTGIGGGIISSGRIVRGSVGMAGELGHITVVPNGNPCGCGNQGCLEKHASATAVTAMARLMQLGEDLTLERCLRSGASGGDEAGDKARQHLARGRARSLGIAIATLINTFNFPLYLLSGGMLPAWEFFAPHMMRVREQRSFTFRATPNETRIAQATLGNRGGLVRRSLPALDREAVARSRAAAGHSGKRNSKTGCQKTPGHDAAAFEHEFRFGPHQPGADLDHPSRSGQADRGRPTPLAGPA